jgi:hypothetical protein
MHTQFRLGRVCVCREREREREKRKRPEGYIPCSAVAKPPVSKETYYSVKRDLLQCQKRPEGYIPCSAVAKPPVHGA